MFIRAAQQFAEKLAFATSAAEALTKTKGFIAALKRCATQNRVFQQTGEGAVSKLFLR
jgi:hypothetical protein